MKRKQSEAARVTLATMRTLLTRVTETTALSLKLLTRAMTKIAMSPPWSKRALERTATKRKQLKRAKGTLVTIWPKPATAMLAIWSQRKHAAVMTVKRLPLWRPAQAITAKRNIHAT